MPPVIDSIIRISTAADGTQGNGDSHFPTFAADGGKVAAPPRHKVEPAGRRYYGR